MDGLEEGDVVVEDEVDTSPLLCGTLAYTHTYIYIYMVWSAAAGEKGREVGWEFIAREFRPFFLEKKKTSNLPASSVGWCQ